MPRSSDYGDTERFTSRRGRSRPIDFAALRLISLASRQLEDARGPSHRSETK